MKRVLVLILVSFLFTITGCKDQENNKENS